MSPNNRMTYATKSDVIINDRFPNFKDLKEPLEQWTILVEQYSNHFDQNHDACYWYNERATLSVLAAAFWKSKDWIALEEFATEKIDAGGDPNPGRCDLYISSRIRSYACEAKQAWDHVNSSNIDSCEVTASAISKTLDAAWEDTAELQKAEADHRLALCFCVPSFNSSENIEEYINKWLECCEKYPYVAFAYCFPQKARKLESVHPNNTGRVFPGVVLIVQHRQRGNSKKKE